MDTKGLIIIVGGFAGLLGVCLVLSKVLSPSSETYTNYSIYAPEDYSRSVQYQNEDNSVLLTTVNTLTYVYSKGFDSLPDEQDKTSLGDENKGTTKQDPTDSGKTNYNPYSYDMVKNMVSPYATEEQVRQIASGTILEDV